MQEAHDYITSALEVQREYRAAYVQATIYNLSPRMCAEIVGRLIDRLEELATLEAKESIENRDVLDKFVTNLPEQFAETAQAAREPLIRQLSRIIFLPDYPQRFVAFQKLVIIGDRDPRSAFKLVVRAVDKGAWLDDTVYTVALSHFRILVGRDVNAVLDFLRALREDYSNNPEIEAILRRLEEDLRIKGLTEVWGPSLRRNFASQLVQSGLIEDGTSIVLVGPSGTSKTFIARRIADNSPFPQLLEIKCPIQSQAKETLDKAFAAAQRENVTILFDEVYALPLELQEYCLTEIGNPNLHLRVLSTSSHSIQYLAKELKRDFWGRINGWQFRLEPLESNREDLEEVIAGLARVEGIDIERRVLHQLLTASDWPENHRGVKRVLHVLGALCRAKKSDTVNVDFLKEVKGELPADVFDIVGPLVGS